jgi:hypothetical protein
MIAISCKGKSKGVPVQDMKARNGSKGMPRVILNLVARWLCVVNLMPRACFSHERIPVSIQ